VCLLLVRAVLIDRENRFTLFRAEFKRDGLIAFRVEQYKALNKAYQVYCDPQNREF
jgi:hypothetical protein